MGFREGWSIPLKTQNFMTKPGPKQSLTDALELGYNHAVDNAQDLPGIDQRNRARGAQLPSRRRAIK